MFEIKSDRLTVLLHDVGEIYTRSRFDWTGIASQVTLDALHTFCVPESFTPGEGSGGDGLCSEFGRHHGLAYPETPVGERFSRPGIGLLRKESRAGFNAFHDYDTIPFPVEVEKRPDRVRYMTEPMPLGGFAFRTVKDVIAEGNTLTYTVTMTNVGEKWIYTEEYAHNFLRIDEHPIGEEYELEVDYPIRMEENPNLYLAGPNENILRLRARNPESGFYFDTLTPEGANSHKWTLRHIPSGVSVAEENDFRPYYVAVWGIEHVISPEILVPIRILPGQSQAWRRKYTFED